MCRTPVHLPLGLCKVWMRPANGRHGNTWHNSSQCRLTLLSQSQCVLCDVCLALSQPLITVFAMIFLPV
jgi:hypothetical protein